VQRGFKTRCRPFHLVEMIKFGFGGLLSLKVKRTATNMLSWLVDCFDHGSCMITTDSKKDFVVTEFDVHDVFCLPCKTSKKVEEISRCANVINPDYDLKEVYEKFLLMKRDLEVVSNFYMDELKVLFQTRKLNDASTLTPPISQTDLFFMDPRVHEIVDEIVSLVSWVSKVPNGLDDADIDDNGAPAKEINVVVGEVPRIGFEHVLSNGKSKCSPAMDELVDYCISDYHGFDLNELLVCFGIPFEITRNEFLSLGEPTIAISSGIIDCWALLLNENQKSSAHGPQKLYFGVPQSSDMLSTFLDQRLPQSNDSVKNMVEYTLESPSLNWKSGKQKNNDSGIYTMVSMLYFDRADEFNCNVLKMVSTRPALRAQIAATLVLSDMNIVRDEVLKKLYEFRLIRSQVAKDVFNGMKKKTKQGKKEKKV
uniref:Uncharacterized protein n=1 Tax=Chenopodium quinoa TaxID=63459 RepID=A0A803LEQ8_CHEQI